MYKYSSFSEYIQLNYFDLIKKELCEFIKEYEVFLYDDKGNMHQYEDYSVNEIKVTNVVFTKNKIDKVEFDVLIRAKFTLSDEVLDIESNFPPFIERTQCYQFSMHGSFKTGFKGKSNEQLKKIDEEPPERLTNGLVPIISLEEMDTYAAKFLKEFCPEALTTPMKLSVTKILEKKGIKFYYAPLEDYVLGKTYFAKDKATIYKEDKEEIINIFNDETEVIDVEPGTILVNFYKHLEYPPGVYRNTMIHEAVHWFFHRNYFELRQLLNNEITSSVCFRGETHYENTDIAWMEWQARSLAPRILMPKKTASAKYDEILEEVEAEGKEKEWTRFEILKKSLERFAKFFGVSKASAKIRLCELGKSALEGIENYIDGEVLQPYSFKKGFLKKNQTFIIGSEQLSRLLTTNILIADALQSEKLLYVNKMLVANNPKYVDSKNYKLTQYGYENVHECCVVFNIQRLGIDKDGVVSEGAYLLSASNQRIENKEVDNEQVNNVIKNAVENSSHYERHKKELALLSFGETIDYHYGKCVKKGVVHTYEDLADKCDIDVKRLRRIRNNEEKPTRIEILRIAVVMRLSAPYIDELINKGDCVFGATTGENNILKTIIYGYQRQGLVVLYLQLEKCNMGKILDLSPRWIKKYIKKSR